MGCSSSMMHAKWIGPLNSINIATACCQPQDGSFRSVEIDEELKTHNEQRKVEIKVLLLGAAEAGKSTIVKQVILTKLQHTYIMYIIL